MWPGRFRAVHSSGPAASVGSLPAAAAAALQKLLGVPDEEVLADYVLSGPCLEAFLDPVFAEFAARGYDPGLLRPILGVDAPYLQAARSELFRCFGRVEAFRRREAPGVDAATQRLLREAFIEPS